VISDRGLLLEKEFQEHLRKVYKKKASYYPEGEIRFKYEHGKHRPYIKDNTGIRYLAADNMSLISKLIQKEIYNRKLKYIDDNLRLLDVLKKEYSGIEWILGNKVISEFEAKIGRGFKVSDYLIENNKKDRLAEFRTENMIHTTPAGVVVRSKAELVIGTFLEMKGISYIYEQPLQLDFRTVVPDFTIKRTSDGKTIIWEHFGMMDDPGYHQNTMDKLYDYHSNGWLPYDNLITTFSEKNSPMDMTTLELICETMLR